jgi:hypothetical protein
LIDQLRNSQRRVSSRAKRLPGPSPTIQPALGSQNNPKHFPESAGIKRKGMEPRFNVRMPPVHEICSPIRGINASQTAGGRLTAASVFAPGLAAVTVLDRSDANSLELPVTSVEALLDIFARRPTIHPPPTVW